MQGPLDAHQIAGIDEWAESSRRFDLTRAHERFAMYGLGMYVPDASELILEVNVSKIVTAIARMLVGAVAGIKDIIWEDGNNEASSEELPPVMPFGLVKLDTRSFSKLLQAQWPRLCCRLGEQEIGNMSSKSVKFQ